MGLLAATRKFRLLYCMVHNTALNYRYMCILLYDIVLCDHWYGLVMYYHTKTRKIGQTMTSRICYHMLANGHADPRYIIFAIRNWNPWRKAAVDAYQLHENTLQSLRNPLILCFLFLHVQFNLNAFNCKSPLRVCFADGNQ